MLTAGVDDLYLRIEGNDGANRHSVLSDANNNTVMLLNAAQDSVASYTYAPYGATTAGSVTGNTHQYTGRENANPNSAAGLDYYRARYYIPGIARFISEDPIGWTSGQANNYAYVGGNPIDFRDPAGLDAAQNFTDVSAGFGDALTFGLTRWIRRKLGIESVNTCSGWYAGGEVAGVVALTVATAGAGAEAEAAADGVEALAEEEAVAEGAGAEGAEQAPNAINPSKQFNPDQRALVELAKDAQRTGVNNAEADTLLEWADEYGLPSRGPEVHPGRPFGQFPPSSHRPCESHPGELMTAHDVRQPVTLSPEPRGDMYRAILRESLHHCSRFSVVQDTRRSMHDSAKLILLQLSPHLVKEQTVSEWPGTRLLKGTAILREYELCADSVTILERTARSFCEWCQPERPEDLVLWRPSNEPWLVTIAHEQDAYFDVTSNELESLVHAIPDLRSLVVSR